jgi:protein-tyrosine phosphatase
MDRYIDFEGIENFRDFGGYATRCGRAVPRERLYRSAHHALATEADLARLAAMGIEVVFDLRRPVERLREPCRHDTYARRVVASEVDVHDGWGESLKGLPSIDGEWFRQDCLTFYRETPFEPRHIELFSWWFHALAEAEGAVLVHCAAGKDRTGMICALTHHIAGVHEDDLMADYLLTNDETRIARKIPLLGDYLEQHFGMRPSDEALRVGVSVAPEYLATAFARMAEDCGGVDGYLERVLGVDAALRERIAAKIVA